MNEELQELAEELQNLKAQKSGMEAILEGITARLLSPLVEKTEDEMSGILAQLETLMAKIEKNKLAIANFDQKILEYREKWGV